MASTDGVYVVAARNWAVAIETYRQSIDLYRHVIQIQAQRSDRVALVLPARPIPLALPAPSPTENDNFGGLTAREREVARLLAHGFTNQQIAETLVITRGTVANHVAHILSKLDLSNRTQVAAFLIGRYTSSASAERSA
jgi:DNA-binding NarL/FixJ family response regulator